MKLNLGKICLIIVIPYFLYAKVVLNAPNSFYQGDSVEFSISANGQNIQLPKIEKIDDFLVQSLGTSTQTNIINGQRTDKYIKTYSFTPNKSITIPTFEVKINGNIEKTQSKQIVMQKVEKTVSDDYNLDIAVDKKKVYVGEAVKFTLLFKYKKDLNIIGLEFAKPKFEDFWVKELKANENLPVDTEYTYQKLEYILFPQKSGKLTVGPLKIEAVTSQSRYRNSFFVTEPTKRTKIYSNTVTLDVEALPKNVKLIGDFEISSTIDKNKIDEGEAVSYKVTIKGRGNLDDIDELQLDIPHTTIYDNPSEKKYTMKNDTYGGVYTKVFSIVPTQNFTIPPISLKYFDKRNTTVKEIKTKSYDIEVKQKEKKTTQLEVNSEDKSTLQLKDNMQTVQISNKEKIFYFIAGLVLGIIITIVVGIVLKNRGKTKEDIPFIKQVKQIKTPDELLKVLVAFINIDEDLDKMIFKLEVGVEMVEFKIMKKEIIAILNEFDKKGIKLDTKF